MLPKKPLDRTRGSTLKITNDQPSKTKEDEMISQYWLTVVHSRIEYFSIER